MTAVNLRTQGRVRDVDHPSILLTSDIRNIKLLHGLLRQSKLPVTDLRKTKPAEKCFKTESEHALNVYDSLKRVVGFDKASDLSGSLSIQMTNGEDVTLQIPGSKPKYRSLVKYVLIQRKRVHIVDDVFELTEQAKEKLTTIGANYDDSADSKASVGTQDFMRTFGSHYQAGTKEWGGVFEWVVTWVNDDDTELTESEDIEREKLARKVLASSDMLEGSERGIWYKAADIVRSDRVYDFLPFKVRVTKFGGEKKNVSFAKWVKYMVSSDETVFVSGGDKLCSVWDLVAKDRPLFSVKEDFSSFLQSVWEKDVRNMDVSANNKIVELLGLLSYKDVGISVDDVRSLALARTGSSKEKELHNIPWMILEKLMRLDYRCRDYQTLKPTLDAHSMLLKGQPAIHPMDVFLLVFMSCDFLLRQVLAKKLALCRLAIPFITQHADSKLEVLLWPLRGVSLQLMSAKGQFVEASLAKHPFKVVSAIRLGNISQSKSKLLNDVMSDIAKDTFFHRDASGGKRKRSVSNGLVEMSYFLPRKGGNDMFNEEIMFLNLRGDALEFQKQSSLLGTISSAMVCIAEVNQFEDDKPYEMLSTIRESCSQIILVLLGNDIKKPSLEQDVDKRLTKSGYEIVKGYDSDDLNDSISASDLANEVGPAISYMLSKENIAKISMLEQKDTFKSKNVAVDEESTPACYHASKDVDPILHELTLKKIAEAKSQLLPLQGAELQSWTWLLKKKHRELDLDAQRSEKEKDQISENMRKLRVEQMTKATPLAPVVKLFIDFQLSERQFLGDECCFKKLKIELDDISRSVLPDLRQNYIDAWQNRERDPESVQKAAKELDETSFGIEHLFRELGQLYECLKESGGKMSKEHKSVFKVLPKLAAKYFLGGHSLEIMDGDASVVPLTWIKAVFGSLHELIGDKQMFVLSVVGVQSSGKSTLLNAMFGLELAVGAGRCTRGIYAQLLPVKASSHLPVDYILVLDSEGLCGTDTAGKHEHDNEIATLVIGLADLTIVNIKGENTRQMQDIFEIAVHSFLRMKAVKKYKKQKCIFLHQSVSAVGAVPHLMRDRFTLQSNLDKMTKQAAESANMAGTINKFNHVIDFDVESKGNIFYIPDLWMGVPPMAQVSTGYSDMVKKVRDHILSDIEFSTCCVTANDMQIRIEDMWNGVLADDFLFSFKNNLSVKAYLQLESKFYETKRFIESSLLEHVDRVSKLKINSCESKDILEEVFIHETKKFQQKVEEISSDCEKNLESYFDESELREHLQPWRNMKVKAIRVVSHEVQDQLKKDLRYFSDCKLLEIEQTVTEKTIIFQRANTHAKELREKNCSDEDLQHQFTNMWSEWEKQLDFDEALNVCDVTEETTKVLHELFSTRGHTKFLKQAMETVWKSHSPQSLNEVTESDMKKEYIANKDFPKGVTQVSKYGKGTELVPKQRSRAEYFPIVVDETNKVLAGANKRIANMCSSNLKFSSHLARDLLHHAMMEVDSLNALPFQAATFTLTAEFEAMLAVRVAKIAISAFDELNAKFVDTCSIKAKLQHFKIKLRHLFLNTVHEKTYEGAIGLLVDSVTEVVDPNVSVDLTRKAVDKLLETIQYNKHTLLIDVLTNLSQKDSFEEYMKFINNVHAYCSQWVERDGRRILFSKVNGSTEYGTLAERLIKDAMGKIRKGLGYAFARAKNCEDESFSMEQFMECLTTSSEKILLLTENDCKLLRNEKVVDGDEFQRVMTARINKIEADVLEKFLSISDESATWKGHVPYKQVMDKIWGCKDSCPVCLSPCVFTNPDHLEDGTNHECLQHWPKGFGGVRWVDTNKLCTEICNFSVTTSSKFRCDACRYRCRDSGNCSKRGKDYASHPYKEYKKFLLHWDIAPDASGKASRYWQWAMHKYQKELATHYKRNSPDIPQSWNITTEDALQSLYELSGGSYLSSNGDPDADKETADTTVEDFQKQNDASRQHTKEQIKAFYRAQIMDKVMKTLGCSKEEAREIAIDIIDKDGELSFSCKDGIDRETFLADLQKIKSQYQEHSTCAKQLAYLFLHTGIHSSLNSYFWELYPEAKQSALHSDVFVDSCEKINHAVEHFLATYAKEAIQMVIVFTGSLQDGHFADGVIITEIINKVSEMFRDQKIVCEVQLLHGPKDGEANKFHIYRFNYVPVDGDSTADTNIQSEVNWISDKSYLLIGAPLDHVTVVGRQRLSLCQDQQQRMKQCEDFRQLLVRKNATKFETTIVSVRSLDGMRHEINKFLQSEHNSDYCPVIIFNGHGCEEGLMLQESNPVNLNEFLEWIRDQLQNMTCGRQIQIVFAQCYGHNYTNPEGNNMLVYHFTSQANVKSNSMINLDPANQGVVSRAVHVGLKMYVKGPDKMMEKTPRFEESDHLVQVLHGIIPGPRSQNLISAGCTFTDQYALIIEQQRGAAGGRMPELEEVRA